MIAYSAPEVCDTSRISSKRTLQTVQLVCVLHSFVCVHIGLPRARLPCGGTTIGRKEFGEAANATAHCSHDSMMATSSREIVAWPGT